MFRTLFAVAEAVLDLPKQAVKSAFDFSCFGEALRHESQGPYPHELAEGEKAGYRWDDRCGWYRDQD